MLQKSVLTTLIILVSFMCNAQKLNELTEEEKKAGWELLFNGKNFEGWKIFQDGEVQGWKVLDGIMSNSGIGSDHGGDIITTKQYQDFELYIEWKIASQSNSGIFIRVQEGGSKKIYETGPEYQLIDDKGWPSKLDDAQYSGSNYDMHKPIGAEVKPIDEWNTTRIIVKGSHVQHFLNGKKVVEYDLWTDEWNEIKKNSKWNEELLYGMSKSGHIGLQDHGGLTQFRNIKIREL